MNTMFKIIIILAIFGTVIAVMKADSESGKTTKTIALAVIFSMLYFLSLYYLCS